MRLIDDARFLSRPRGGILVRWFCLAWGLGDLCGSVGKNVGKQKKRNGGSTAARNRLQWRHTADRGVTKILRVALSRQFLAAKDGYVPLRMSTKLTGMCNGESNAHSD
ncbi:hypothetical protein E2542_SST19968 [Spatholobus suberectus]|nr:hypothetical protein E2542_SST19968 [Spatholobus suberectus]